MNTIFFSCVEIGDGFWDYSAHMTRSGAEDSMRTKMCEIMGSDPSEYASMSLEDLTDHFSDETDYYLANVREMPLLT
ncbi:hypothetical protein SAMN02799631_06348 [Methylobacterium sp. 174MFSha1.1]|uniref:hypothetical protein n=1 Tax=Methylobacterium sp. 174MFSha1.1 TaxID=1502749 RepID=UPI0008F3EA6B|nr:hypothetical protein [Methylobacterium sp. 174MFSha1.1]SFV16252.1 hypothetical protein SAMN02799631_06348 [Methylobacterium sp. 174MFSha1.1]